MDLYHQAADYCQKLAQRSQSNFYYAFLFLPRHRREALNAVYAYCRLIDDIVDGPQAAPEKRQALGAWREELRRAFLAGEGHGAPEHPVARGLSQAHRRFGVRYEDALAVLEGCEMDLDGTRYRSWADLERYCYHVASAVGLLCIEIFGYQDASAREYAIHLGLALQLTNIIRDVAEDAARGRIYLPLEDLDAFGVGEEDLLAGRRTEAALRLLQFEALRARGHYDRARAALSPADRRSLVVAEIMGDIYHALLDKIERGGFDVFAPSGKVALHRRHKLGIALSTYGRSRLGSRSG